MAAVDVPVYYPDKPLLRAALSEAGLLTLQLVKPYDNLPPTCWCCTGCRPFLMQAKMSYTKIGIFSLASYPYRQADSQRAPPVAARTAQCTDASRSRNLRQCSALNSLIHSFTHSLCPACMRDACALHCTCFHAPG
jgi:hypothetical protein